MSQVFLNGQFLPRSQAAMDLEDRGTMFGDGVYEVLRYYRGKPFGFQRHLDRLQGSLQGIGLEAPPDVSNLYEIGSRLVRENQMPEARVYWQITRGAAPRDHTISPHTKPTLLVIAYPEKPVDREAAPTPASAILAEDERWHHCWIKSVMLLPNVLALRKAQKAGAGHCILHRSGRVTEATSANVFLVRDGLVRTHPADQWILNGITRQVVIEAGRADGIEIREEAFQREDLLSADEVVISGTTCHVLPIVAVDGRPVGNGKPGPMGERLNRLLMDRVEEECGRP